MFKIKIFSDFCSSDECKKTFENINNAKNIPFYGKDKKVYIVGEGEEYTHAIIINKAMPELNIPRKNVIGLAFEPYEFLRVNPEFIEYAKRKIGKYFIGEKRFLPKPFIENFAYMWHGNPHCDLKNKPKIMSLIVSNKRIAPGHIYRHNLIEKIIEKNLPIDIYGNGSKQYNYDFVKGPFDGEIPYEEYKFTISIENYSCNDYISEKFMSPLLHNCKPIYLGCKKIKKYFNEKDYISLSGNVDEDIDLLIKILDSPERYYSKTFTQKNRKTVNFIENVENIFTVT